MKNVYAIIDYNETAHTEPVIKDIYATQELAIEQLRRWRDAIAAGKWDGVVSVKWHDGDNETVTQMRVSWKGYRYFTDGVTAKRCYSVEPVTVKETEDDLVD